MKKGFDWFLGGMAGVTVLAWAFPEPGATGGWLRPEVTTKAGVALVFFLHGLALSFPALRAGVLNWRLHLLVQATTFGLFPLAGLALFVGLGGKLGPELLAGLFFLCALPSTVSSSVALTAAARGNVAGAVFNATLSSLLGVVLTPLWVAWALRTSGQTQPLWPVVADLLRWLVLPLALGQAARPWLGPWAARHKPRIAVVDRLTVLLLVYTSFCDSFQQEIWSRGAAGEIVLVAALCAALLAAALAGTAWLARRGGFAREDRIAAVLCGSKKTLAAGVPMAKLIFGAHPGLALMLVPIMVYHSMQLFVCGVLAQRWAREETSK